MPPWKSDLHRSNLQFLKDGRSGNVYKTGYKLRGDPTELAYKEYKPPVSVGAQPEPGAAAEKAARFRARLRPAGRDDLDRFFAWPREVVIDDATGEICGFLMPLAGQGFFWQQGKPKGQPRTLDWLITTQPSWQVNRVDLSDVIEADRLFLMVQLVYAVDWLHKRGWVFGDLSFTNAAFALSPPRLMLFDCDDAAELADLEQRKVQPHSPNWHPPECEGGQQHEQDLVTDVYKLGLAIVRCLKPELRAGATRDVGRLTGILDPEGIALLTRALSTDRKARPSAEDLLDYLKRVTEPRLVEPQIKSAELATSLVMRGANARILWQIKNAEEIQVFLGENPPQLVRHVTPANSPGGCAFAVTQPGQVTVLARNRFGTAERVIGDVAPFEMPTLSLDLDKLSGPNIAVPAFAATPLPPSPAGPPAAPDIPPVQSLEFADVLSKLAPGGTISSPGTYINTVVDSSRSLLNLIHMETERFIAERRRKSMRNGHG